MVKINSAGFWVGASAVGVVAAALVYENWDQLFGSEGRPTVSLSASEVLATEESSKDGVNRNGIEDFLAPRDSQVERDTVGVNYDVKVDFTAEEMGRIDTLRNEINQLEDSIFDPIVNRSASPLEEQRAIMQRIEEKRSEMYNILRGAVERERA